MIASAPGKAILCGEYAVLHGAPAVAVAVDRYARAQFADVDNESPFVRQAFARACGGKGPARVTVDTRALYEGDHKIGLGSSAAVTVATVGLCFGEVEDRQRIFEVADQAHAEAQGTRGSGIDVACATFGGAILFRRNHERVQIDPIDLPDGVQLTFVYMGRSASTPEFVARVRTLAASAPLTHAEAMDRLGMHAGEFVEAIAEGDANGLLAAADEYHEAMAHLGEEAGLAIVTPEHARIAEIARKHGSAAKPSGAGGGDLAVAFTVGESSTAALRAALSEAGFHPLSISAPAEGLRLET
jgi:phosphomevalonate kinase